MRVLIVTPESLSAPLGNSITATRWGGILRKLGQEVAIAHQWNKHDADLLIALHAARSATSVEEFHRAYPERPIIVALTGTDLYRDLADSDSAHRSLAAATRVVALQEHAPDELDDDARAKTRIIYQSAAPPLHHAPASNDYFDVCVLSHLRAVKDPLRAAYAARLLPSHSRIRVTHVGRLLEPEWEEKVRAEQSANQRYRWIGELAHESAKELLAASRLLVVSSTMEGGANAIAEAVVCGVPVLCSDIPGNIGMLGRDYPGYFRVGNTEELADLLNRCEVDSAFLAGLHSRIEKLRDRFAPEQEMACWARLLADLTAR